tara:strand:+ start:996 stop:1469 length:474 start_codon:yes stop_codon:yes gene_type:complete
MENKSFNINWEIEVTATSPKEAAKLALEIQRDPSSEAVNFDVEELATGEKTEVDLSDETKGSDICYGCGKAQKYHTMQDIDEDDFAIYCEKCHSKETSKRWGETTEALTGIRQKLEALEEILNTNSSREDWTDADVSMEMDYMYGKVNKIKKDLESL